MGELMKRTEDWRVDTEEQATALIDQAKEKESTEGYELVSYKMVKKIRSRRVKLLTNG